MSSTAVQSDRPAAHRARPVRLLLIEDVETDAALVVRVLTTHGYQVSASRVDDAASIEAALAEGPWDLCISNYSLPRIDAARALAVVRRLRPDLPFIVVSGAMSEERAVLVMRAGARDCISKQHLSRLGPAVDRELGEAENRRLERASENARKRAEEARASDLRFQSLIAAMREVVFSADAELRYTGVYGNLTELGFPEESVIGKRPQDLLEPPLASLHETAYRKALDGEPVVFDWSMAKPTGTRHYQTSVSPLRDDSGAIKNIVGVTREITRQKEMQEQLLLSERLAIVGSMTASLTHEINNPLTSLLLNLECLMSQSEQVTEPLSDAWTAARRVLDIVTDVKLIARAADARHGSVDICSLLDTTVRLAAPELRYRAQVVKQYPATSVYVQGNESRLGQVFLNLLLNAAQAIPAGRIDKSSVRLVVHADGDTTTVEIIDTGVGMPREVLARLFTPFFTTKPAGEGSGIGLSISKRIIDSVGGRIEVDSEVGRGTTFRVILPSVPPEP